MEAILFDGEEPFEVIIKTPATKGSKWILVKIGQMVSEKKTLNDYSILNLVDLESLMLNTKI